MKWKSESRNRTKNDRTSCAYVSVYTYTGNDPLDKTDPTGLGAWDDFQVGLVQGAAWSLNNQAPPPSSGWTKLGQAVGAVGAGMSRQQLSGLTPVARSAAPAAETPAGIPDSNVVARGGANNHAGVYYEGYE